MTPSATPLVTTEALLRLRDAGLHRLALSLDGVEAATHDAFRGVFGSFDRTLEILAEARRSGLPLQVNTTIAQSNVHQVDDLAEMLSGLGLMLWSVLFLVPVGRGEQLERISPQQYEEVFERLWHHAQRQPYGIKTTEAPHDRRFVRQRRGDPQQNPERTASPQPQRAPLGRHICSGSRARSFALTGDLLAAEPDCDYLPVVASAAANSSAPEASSCTP